MTKPSSEKKEPFWDDAKKADLTKMWNDRVPRISEFFNVTNNSIAGITDRLGLRRSHPNNCSAATFAARKAAENKKRMRAALKKSEEAKKLAAEALQKKAETQKTISLRLPAQTALSPSKAPSKAKKPTPPPVVIDPLPKPPISIPDTISKNPKPWVKRRTGECAYPVKEPSPLPMGWSPADQKSCCNKTDDGQTYCDGHRKIMFEESRPRGSRKKVQMSAAGSRVIA